MICANGRISSDPYNRLKYTRIVIINILGDIKLYAYSVSLIRFYYYCSHIFVLISTSMFRTYISFSLWYPPLRSTIFAPRMPLAISAAMTARIALNTVRHSLFVLRKIVMVTVGISEWIPSLLPIVSQSVSCISICPIGLPLMCPVVTEYPSANTLSYIHCTASTVAKLTLKKGVRRYICTILEFGVSFARRRENLKRRSGCKMSFFVHLPPYIIDNQLVTSLYDSM